MGDGCSFCGGPWHPATGCYYGPRFRSCHVCTRDFWAWVKRHTSSKAKRRHPNGVDFYTAAGNRTKYKTIIVSDDPVMKAVIVFERTIPPW